MIKKYNEPTQIFNLRLGQSLHDLIYRAATEENRSMTDFIQVVMRKESNRILRDKDEKK